MTDRNSKPEALSFMNPSTERLLSKFTDLEETLKLLKEQHRDDEHAKITIDACETYLKKARYYLGQRGWGWSCPFSGRRHPHLVWELLHRVDECFILLIKKEELFSRAITLKTSFDLNIKEEKVRKEWIGEEGKEGRFKKIIDELEKGENLEPNTIVLRDALRIVNEQMDRTFWQLSMNTLTSVWSGTFLAGLMALAWYVGPWGPISLLKGENLCENYLTLIALGLMGAYLSNLITKEDFLYVRGGPFWRYFLHNLFAKPVTSAFAAVFIYFIEKSKLIFSIGLQENGAKASKAAEIITLNVSSDSAGYVYAVIAIASGFAADKILRSTIDGVLKKLEQKAEKSKDTEKK